MNADAARAALDTRRRLARARLRGTAFRCATEARGAARQVAERHPLGVVAGSVGAGYLLARSSGASRRGQRSRSRRVAGAALRWGATRWLLPLLPTP